MFAAGLLSLASAGIGAVGAMQQANAQANAAKYEAQVREQQAQSERQRAAAQAQDYRRQESSKLATSRARLAGSGVSSSFGTPLLVDESAVREIALSSSRITNAGEINATRLENEAASRRSAAKNYRTAGAIGAGASLLSGVRSFF